MEDKEINYLIEAVLNENKITAMAQKQGKLENFVFYTLDNEPIKHKPHIHVCVTDNNAKEFNGGKQLRDGSHYKTLFSITLNPDENFIYTHKNIQIEYSYIGYPPNWILKICAEWLNKYGKVEKTKNAVRSLLDYIRSNGAGVHEKDYKYWIDLVNEE